MTMLLLIALLLALWPPFLSGHAVQRYKYVGHLLTGNPRAEITRAAQLVHASGLDRVLQLDLDDNLFLAVPPALAAGFLILCASEVPLLLIVATYYLVLSGAWLVVRKSFYLRVWLEGNPIMVLWRHLAFLPAIYALCVGIFDRLV